MAFVRERAREKSAGSKGLNPVTPAGCGKEWKSAPGRRVEIKKARVCASWMDGVVWGIGDRYENDGEAAAFPAGAACEVGNQSRYYPASAYEQNEMDGACMKTRKLKNWFCSLRVGYLP